MTALELLGKQIEDSGYQLGKVFEGMTDAQQDHKLYELAMSPRETLEHLAEAYTCLMTEARGEKYEWGSFSIPDRSWKNLISTFEMLRAHAAKVALSDEKWIDKGTAFIVAHDYYHVGALAQVRIATDPSWDSYSIYRF